MVSQADLVFSIAIITLIVVSAPGSRQYLQKLIHPCQSVWCCAFLPNGDIVSAGSDHAIRIWTTSSDRLADPNVLEVSGLVNVRPPELC
jgi:WD40 repeat protein